MAQPTAEIRAERRRLRALRLALPRHVRLAAGREIAATLRRLRVFRRGRRVAVYLALTGEVSLEDAVVAAHASGAEIYVPQVTSRRLARMRFVRLRRAAPLRLNTYGIAEPAGHGSESSPPRRLDVILLPVVGFDREGNRLGMGAGYYDRALRLRRDRERVWRRPRLVGIAFACQEVARIDSSPADVALDLVVTEREIIIPRRRAARPLQEHPN
jgi:5-formyltetrahydrofolate cyclo-ligase